MLKLLFLVFSQASCWLKHAGRVLCYLAVMPAIMLSAVQAEKAWYPVEVDVWNPPFNDQRQREQKLYTPLERAQKKWRIRVFIPHLKDDYWLGVNYGLIHEARRLEVSLSIFEAGGYDQLEVQRRQIENAIAENPDGLIIGAISLDGLNDLVKKASDKGIPVLDLINGLSSPQIAARTAVSFWDMGFQAGSYLRVLQKKSGQPIKKAWYPGPNGAGWVKAGDAGHHRAIEGSTN